MERPSEIYFVGWFIEFWVSDISEDDVRGAGHLLGAAFEEVCLHTAPLRLENTLGSGDELEPEHSSLLERGIFRFEKNFGIDEEVELQLP